MLRIRYQLYMKHDTQRIRDQKDTWFEQEGNEYKLRIFSYVIFDHRSFKYTVNRTQRKKYGGQEPI